MITNTERRLNNAQEINEINDNVNSLIPNLTTANPVSVTPVDNQKLVAALSSCSITRTDKQPTYNSQFAKSVDRKRQKKGYDPKKEFDEVVETLKPVTLKPMPQAEYEAYVLSQLNHNDKEVVKTFVAERDRENRHNSDYTSNQIILTKLQKLKTYSQPPVYTKSYLHREFQPTKHIGWKRKIWCNVLRNLYNDYTSCACRTLYRDFTRVYLPLLGHHWDLAPNTNPVYKYFCFCAKKKKCSKECHLRVAFPPEFKYIGYPTQIEACHATLCILDGDKPPQPTKDVTHNVVLTTKARTQVAESDILKHVTNTSYIKPSMTDLLTEQSDHIPETSCFQYLNELLLTLQGNDDLPNINLQGNLSSSLKQSARRVYTAFTNVDKTATFFSTAVNSYESFKDKLKSIFDNNIFSSIYEYVYTYFNTLMSNSAFILSIAVGVAGVALYLLSTIFNCNKLQSLSKILTMMFKFMLSGTALLVSGTMLFDSDDMLEHFGPHATDLTLQGDDDLESVKSEFWLLATIGKLFNNVKSTCFTNRIQSFLTACKNCTIVERGVTSFEKIVDKLKTMWDWVIDSVHTWYYGYSRHVKQNSVQSLLIAVANMKANPTRYPPPVYLYVDAEIKKAYRLAITSDNMPLINALNNAINVLDHAREIAVKEASSARSGCVPSFVVEIKGESGHGKSTAVRGLATALSFLFLGTKDLYSVYYRNNTLEYWDDYNNQLICVIDDWGQLVDSQTNPSGDFFTLIQMKNIADFMLNMAQCDQKGLKYFTSPIVILTSNLPRIDKSVVKSVTTPAAVLRRLDIIITCTAKNEYVVDSVFGEKPTKPIILSNETFAQYVYNVFSIYYQREFEMMKKIEDVFVNSVANIKHNWKNSEVFDYFMRLVEKRKFTTLNSIQQQFLDAFSDYYTTKDKKSYSMGLAHVRDSLNTDFISRLNKVAPDAEWRESEEYLELQNVEDKWSFAYSKIMEMANVPAHNVNTNKIHFPPNSSPSVSQSSSSSSSSSAKDELPDFDYDFSESSFSVPDPFGPIDMNISVTGLTSLILPPRIFKSSKLQISTKTTASHECELCKHVDKRNRKHVSKADIIDAVKSILDDETEAIRAVSKICTDRSDVPALAYCPLDIIVKAKTSVNTFSTYCSAEEFDNFWCYFTNIDIDDNSIEEFLFPVDVPLNVIRFYAARLLIPALNTPPVEPSKEAIDKAIAPEESKTSTLKICAFVSLLITGIAAGTLLYNTWKETSLTLQGASGVYPGVVTHTTHTNSIITPPTTNITHQGEGPLRRGDIITPMDVNPMFDKLFVEPNGASDANAKMLVTKISAQLARAFTETGKGASNILFLDTMTFIMVGHSLSNIKNDDFLQLVFPGKGITFANIRIPLKECHWCFLKDTTDTTDIDAVMIRIPYRCYIPGMKSLRPYFVDSQALLKVHERPVALVSVCIDEKKPLPILHQTASIQIRDIEQVHINLRDYEYKVTGGDSTTRVAPQSAMYKFHGKAGDCGGICVARYTHLPNAQRIFGLHFGEVESTQTGYSVIITREQLERAYSDLDMYSKVNPISADGEHSEGYNGSTKIITTDPVTLQGAEYLATVVDPDPPLNFHPTFEKTYRSTESRIRLSKIGQQQVLPRNKAPAILKPQTIITPDGCEFIIDPNTKALRKFVRSDAFIDPAYLQKSVDNYINMIDSIHKMPIDRRLLTIDEAVFGVEGDPFLSSLKSDTSMGWLLKKMFPGKGKHPAINFETRILKQELIDLVFLRESLAKQGIALEAVFQDCLKDEKRLFEKIEQLKTRLFSAGPLDLTILMRMYFGSFISWMMHNRIDNESAVGINPASFEWEVLAEHLLKKGDRIIAGDFENIDGTEKRAILMAIVEIVNHWYNDGPENADIRRVIWTSVIGALHINNGFFYTLFAANPSGNLMTTFINTMYLCLLFRYVYYKLLSAQKLDPVKHAFHKHVTMISFGDDNVLGIDDFVAPWFNLENIKREISQIGMTYTDEKKTGDVKTFRHLQEVTFLKRDFFFDNERKIHIGRLDLPTILEIPNWQFEDSTNADICMSIENCLRELALHPKDVYNYWSKIITRAAHKAHYPFIQSSREAYLESIFENQNLVDTSVFY
jgi:hypothetical protein